jgi:thiol-disulfide isomerase/thioredoxin
MFWKRYIVSFIITVVLFILAFYLSNQLANKKVDQVRVIQDKISTDILSTETRFILLGSSSCKHIESNDEFEAELNSELSDMARRVKFMENQLGYDDERVLLIKNQYALFQIKDYLLHKQLSERCGEKITTILYFHNPKCEDCKDQSLVLDEINNKYPSVRIYWLDTDSNTPALTTLISMFDITSTPTILIGEKKYEGFQSIEKLSAIFDKTEKPKTKTTTTTKDTTKPVEDTTTKDETLKPTSPTENTPSSTDTKTN